jgi:putative SOS response-associated peptidase YedK
MCGRYTIVVSLDELIIRYGAYAAMNQYHLPHYNVAPMQDVAVVIHDGERNRLGALRWGLVPGWASDDKFENKLINARAETLLEKASFKNLIHRKRCIVPADGFYEWKQIGNKKQPMRITMKDHSIFSLAALYDSWTGPDGKKLSTCTIITTTSNSLMQDLHDRMPVILNPEEEQLWLNRNNHDVDQLVALLKPYSSDAMKVYPVSSVVGNVRNDSVECIAKWPQLELELE